MSSNKDKLSKSVEAQGKLQPKWLQYLGGVVVIGGVGYMLYQRLKNGESSNDDNIMIEKAPFTRPSVSAINSFDFICFFHVYYMTHCN